MKCNIEKEKIQLEKDGKVTECDILFTFNSQDTMKSYIGYTDQNLESNGRKNIYISAYNLLKPTIELEDVTDEKELEMIHHVLKELDNNATNS